MLNLRTMNPMVRAVGTMGAVSVLVGGITFASLTSNMVALTPSNLIVQGVSKSPTSCGTNNSSVNVNNNTTQTSNTGNANATGGGSATSGSASNSNSTGTTITVTQC